MDYIVLDMEWNQPHPDSPSARKVLPSPIRGEIIQIGAVRLTEEQILADEFQILVKPQYYRKLNRRISKLTGLKDARLSAEGVSFPEACQAFRDWCGENVVFLTWGYDDIPVLRENLRLFQLPEDWVDRWYNAQMIFNAQTDGASSQKALGTAMELFGIEPSRPAHDALGDAYHTALICARLDLKRGMEVYDQPTQTFRQVTMDGHAPGCLYRRNYYDFPDKSAVLDAMSGPENLCPVCGRQMQGNRWFAQSNHRYMDMVTCPEHGQYLIRIRMSPQESGGIRVTRLTYDSGSEAAEAYLQRISRIEAAKAADAERSAQAAAARSAKPARRRRRRRNTSKKKTAQPSQMPASRGEPASAENTGSQP